MRPLAISAFALALASPTAAWAEEKRPRSDTHDYSKYEKQALSAAIDKHGLAIEPDAEGKTIESVEIVRLEVIEDRDPAPLFLNKFHTTTRDYVVRRELLQKPGDKYQKLLIDETARNIRLYAGISVVLVVAIRGSTPDKVRVMVITKDVWSLRLGWDLVYTNGGINRLALVPSEINVAGTQQTVALRYEMRPLSQSFAARFASRRLFGTRVTLSSEAGVHQSRASGQLEGSFAAIAVDKPLWSTQEDWAYGASAGENVQVLRRYKNVALATYLADTGERVPWVYKERLLTAKTYVTRSFGWGIKHDVTLGTEATRKRYTASETDGASDAAVREFLQENAPRGISRVFPYLSLRAYSTSFLRSFDLETLALQEDVRLGHDVLLKAYPVSSALGSDRSFFGFAASGRYTFELGDGYARAYASTLQEGIVGQNADAAVAGGLRVVTPRLPFGRFVVDGTMVNRYHNAQNQQTLLGSDTGLRGYTTSAFAGPSYATYNFELRTRALPVKTVQVGGVLFHDVGAIGKSMTHLDAHTAVGGGLRILFPQLDRFVFRIDLGTPIEDGKLGKSQLFVGFGQGFSSAPPTL